ncbi:MAG: Na+/H+ antiporter NhaA [Bacteroidia bacterium]|nr:Na+/H+ antiporter NhaA [Bacteroidia bacterium]
MHIRLMQAKSYFYNGFMQLVTNNGYLLILATLLSVVLSNSGWGAHYLHAIHMPLFSFVPNSSAEWCVNDVLMTFFFLIVAIELKYELTQGALNTIKLAAMPIYAAVGGMLVPAFIFYLFNIGSATANGWAIPMATDIAFALALYNVFGNKLPPYLKIILSALAVVDDFGSILAIALFYSNSAPSLVYGILTLVIIAVLILGSKKNIHAVFYIVMLTVLWWCMYNIGVHPTMSAVAVGLIAPYHITSQWLHVLHKWVYYLIVPLFAMLNTAIVIDATALQSCLTSTLVWGVIAGLVVGKPLGIVLGVYASKTLGWAKLPANISVKHILMMGILAGIGFTVSLFISSLAFGNSTILLTQARIAVLVAGVFTVIVGKMMSVFFKA